LKDSILGTQDGHYC